MKLKKLGTATIILLLVGLMFSSCDPDRDHYYWTPGQVRNDITDISSDGRGYFNTFYDIDIRRDVYDSRGRNFWDVSEIRFLGGDFEIFADDDYLAGDLVLMDGNREVAGISLGRGYVGRNLYHGRDVEDFLADVAYYLNRSGRARMMFLAESRYIGKTYMDVSIIMNIDAYVRD